MARGYGAPSWKGVLKERYGLNLRSGSFVFSDDGEHFCGLKISGAARWVDIIDGRGEVHLHRQTSGDGAYI